MDSKDSLRADYSTQLLQWYLDIFLQFPYFDGIHRFLPALFKGYGYSTDFIPVDHRLREKGYSNYGTLKRLFQGIFDLIRVIIIIRGYKRNLND